MTHRSPPDPPAESSGGETHRVGSVIPGLPIVGMSHGADAIARQAGRVLFVEGGAPGDVADVVVIETRRRFSRAAVQTIRASGPARRPAPCPYVGRCGGCQWQHLTYAAQLEAKQQNLVDHLTRIGGLSAEAVRPAVAAPAEWRYRHRIQLRVDGRRLGFYRAQSHELIEIDECHIAAEPLERGLAAARAWLRHVSTTVRRLALVVSEADAGLVLAANAEGPFQPADDAWNLETVGRFAGEGIRGIVMFGRGWRRRWGEHSVTFTVAGLPLTTTGGEFTQVNIAANRLLVNTVLSLADVDASGSVVDLFCGAGNLSLPLARSGARVTGVERSAAAVADAEANARRLGVRDCRFVCATVEAALSGGLGEQLPTAPDVVVLDPPRGGAPRVLGSVLGLGPRRIVYVSCDPPALARDLAVLTREGYRLAVVQPLDLFPNTYHLEAVALLTAA